jgi:hypothetical protein
MPAVQNNWLRSLASGEDPDKQQASRNAMPGLLP